MGLKACFGAVTCSFSSFCSKASSSPQRHSASSFRRFSRNVSFNFDLIKIFNIKFLLCQNLGPKLVLDLLMTCLYKFLQIFVSAATLGTSIGLIIYFVTASVTIVLGTGAYDFLSLSEKFALCLLPNFGLAMGFLIIGNFEDGEKGMKYMYMKKICKSDNIREPHILKKN